MASFFFHSTPIILFCGQGGSGKSTAAHTLKKSIRKQTGITPVVLATDKITFPQGDPSPRFVKEEERKLRYQELRKQFVRTLNEKPGTPVILDGMFNRKEIRDIVTHAARDRKIAIHIVRVHAPYDARHSRIKFASRWPWNWTRTRHGSRLSAGNLKKFRDKIDEFEPVEQDEADKPIIEISNRGKSKELKEKIHELAQDVLKQYTSQRMSKREIHELFKDIEGIHVETKKGEFRPLEPRERIHQLLLYLRDKYKYHQHGDVSFLGLKAVPSQRYEPNDLEFWSAIGQAEPEGKGEKSIEELTDSVLPFSRTAHAWGTGENLFQTRYYKGLRHDDRYHQITGGPPANGMYFPIPAPDAISARALHPLGTLPDRPLGVFAFYSKRQKNEALFNEIAKILEVGKQYLQKWLVEEFEKTDLSVSDLTQKMIMVNEAEREDPKRIGHSMRVATLARLAAEKTNWFAPHELEQLEAAAQLHDLQRILGKPRQPSDPDDPPRSVTTFFPFHDQKHDIVQAVADVHQTKGKPAVFIEDEEGQLTRVEKLGCIAQLDRNQLGRIARGKLTLEQAYTERVKQIVEQPELFSNDPRTELDIGNFTKPALFAIDGGLRRFRVFKKLRPVAFPRVYAKRPSLLGPAIANKQVGKLHPYAPFIQAAKAFDQLVSGQTKPALSVKDSLNEIKKMARQGTLDARVVRRLARILTDKHPKLEEIYPGITQQRSA